jgi:minor histocompatibility antigen H13
VLLGTFGLVATAEPLAAPFVPRRLRAAPIELRVPRIPRALPDGLDLAFTPLEAALALPAAAFCAWYWTSKHWAANNALGLAFSLQGVEQLSLGSVQNGVILLAGLFVYDVFWVFCTPVMVSVAKSFDAPIKLLFPRFPAAGAAAGAKPLFSMLGLGDIVIPGIFVAIVLRYDAAHAPGGRPRLFYSAFAGYVGGLAATIVVMNVFQAAQPALLYIVPALLAATFAHAAARGEASALMYWEEAGGEAAAAGGGAGEGAAGEEDLAAAGVRTPEKAAGGGEPEPDARRTTRSASKTAKKDA